LFEQLETRCLFSATIAQLFTPHVAAGSLAASEGTPAVAVAYITDNAADDIDLTQSQVSVVADDGEAVSAVVDQTDDGNVAVLASLPADASVGAHGLVVDVSQVDSDGNVVAQLIFRTTVIVDPPLPSAPPTLTLTGDANQAVSGYLGTLSHLPAGVDMTMSPDTGPVIIPAGDGVNATQIDVTINWGDGNSDEATLVQNQTGGYDVYGQHVYAAAGTYDVQIVAEATATTDPSYQGPPIAVDGTVTTVDQVDSTAVIAASPTTPLATTTGEYAGTVATLPTTPAAGASTWIEWGDGTTSPATLTPNSQGGVDISGDHTYAFDSTYTINVLTNTSADASALGISTTDGVSVLAAQQTINVTGTTPPAPPANTYPPSPICHLPIMFFPVNSGISPVVAGTVRPIFVLASDSSAADPTRSLASITAPTIPPIPPQSPLPSSQVSDPFDDSTDLAKHRKLSIGPKHFAISVTH
jgi:hypothetical protein